MEKQHSQSFLQKRKLLVFLPIVGVPFLAIFFSLLGGGRQAIAEGNRTFNNTMGLNTIVPNASEDNKIYASKLKAYEQVALDSAARKKNNARSILDTDLMGLLSSDSSKSDDPNATTTPKPNAFNYDLNRGFAEQANAPEQLALAEGQRELEEAKRLSSGNSSAARGYSSNGATGSTGRGYGRSTNVEPSSEAERKIMEEIEAQRKQRDELVSMLKRKLEQSESYPNPAATENLDYRLTSSGRQSAKNRKITVKVEDDEKPLVSRLGQNEQKIARQAPDTGNTTLEMEKGGFYSPLTTQKTKEEANVISAVIHDEQTLFSGSTVKMRLLNTIKIGNNSVPKGTFIYGLCSITDERLKIKISSIRYQELLLPVDLSVFDIDGIEGLFMPGSLSRTVVKQGASQGIGSANFIGTSPSVTSQLTQTAIEAGKNIASKKAALVRVTLKSNYQILLKPSED